MGCCIAEVYSRKAVFEGRSDLDQLSRLAKAMGAATEENWPGVSTLPQVSE
jgi:hypothetical protein